MGHRIDLVRIAAPSPPGRDRYRADCSCGWRSSDSYRSPGWARQAWRRHSRADRFVVLAASYVGAPLPEMWGERVKRLREARGMSRAELAEVVVRLGRRIDARDLRRYEEEDYQPRLLTFAALARALGVSMETLVYGEEGAVRITEERARG
jgi:ribosome-binding protein aMBF1 (putative translation factor)